MVARGWGIADGGGPVYLRHNTSCTMVGIEVPGVVYDEDSFFNAKGYDCNPPTEECVVGEDTACGWSDSAWREQGTPSGDTQLTALAPINLSPVGKEILSNAFTKEDFILERIKLARDWSEDDEEWSEPEEGYPISGYLKLAAAGDPMSQFLYQIGRFRFRFPVPVAGYEVTWEVQWVPLTFDGLAWNAGEPEAVESGGFTWNGSIPEDYDDADQATWPVSPWFELPEVLKGDELPTDPEELAELDGYFRIVNVEAKCGEATPLGTVAGLEGYVQ